MIRFATKEDIPNLLPLLESLFLKEQEFHPDHDLHTLGLAKILDDEKIGFILVYELDSKIVGMVNILFTISTALGSKVALLEDMIVFDEYQKMGIGSTLVKEAISILKDLNFKRITLLTDQVNEQAIRFYTNLGFKQSKMIPLRLNF